MQNPEEEQNLQERLRQEAQRRQAEQQKQALLRSLLEPRAKERLTRISLADPEKARKVEELIFSLHKAGGLRGQISDEDLVKVLQKVSSMRRETRITRR